MIEWIVLIWTVANPLTGFQGNVVESKLGKRPPQVFITSTTADFTIKWETLSSEEKKDAQVYVGTKSMASIVLVPDLENSINFPKHTHCGVVMIRNDKNVWQCMISGYLFQVKDDFENLGVAEKMLDDVPPYDKIWAIPKKD